MMEHGTIPLPSKSNPPALRSTKKEEVTFSEVVRLIAASREKVVQSVNTALIDLYWELGATISRKIEAAEWGDGTVDRLAVYIAKTEPGLRGFSRANLFRMKQFYGTYRDEPIVSPLVRQLPWSHHLVSTLRCRHAKVAFRGRSSPIPYLHFFRWKKEAGTRSGHGRCDGPRTGAL
jgi:hypothetical protein